MQCKALKSFDSKPLRGHIRAGMTFFCEPRYGNELKKNGLVEIISTDDPAPGSNKAVPRAPKPEGKETAPPQQPGETAPSQDDGPAQPSASSPAAQASPVTTVTTSNAGGRRGGTTLRRKAPAKQPAK